MDQLKCKWLPLMSKAPTPASLSLGNSQFFWQACLNIFEILKKGNQSATACPDFGTFFSYLFVSLPFSPPLRCTAATGSSGPKRHQT